MPKIDGISFLKLLLPQYPIPVVAISSESSYVFEVMKAGAVDFVCKTRAEDEDKDVFFRELIAKVKIASIAKVGNQVGKRTRQGAVYGHRGKDTDKIIAIGASTGGTGDFQDYQGAAEDGAGNSGCSAHAAGIHANVREQTERFLRDEGDRG